jgi:hypothetical protein
MAGAVIVPPMPQRSADTATKLLKLFAVRRSDAMMNILK